MKTYTITRRATNAAAFNLDEALNAQQRAAVTCGPGPKLVIAGAGSGKTRTITYRVAYLLAQGVAPTHLLLATFTNKAAREMLRRVEALAGQSLGGLGTGPERSRRGQPTGALWGGTFHALGNRFLRQHAALVGYAPNYSILDEEDQGDLLKVCLDDLPHREHLNQERFPHVSVLREVFSQTFNNHRALAELVEDRYPHFSRWIPELERLAVGYQKKKRQTNAMDYDDLLRYWHQALSEHPALLAQYGRLFQHILVDEYQDTNQLQAEIVELLAAHNGRNLMVVGDDCQCVLQGTQVLTPSGWQRVERLRAGMFVLAGAGNGRLVRERITAITQSHYQKYVDIVTKGGLQLKLSPRHLCFARVAPHRYWYVYLMYKDPVGFRIGVTQIARHRPNDPSIQMRTMAERADRIWLLEAHPTRQMAQYRETILSLRYRVPQAIFRPLDDRANTVMRQQSAAIFQEFGANGHRLLHDFHLLFDYPTFIPKASRSNRRIVINLVMADSGTQQHKRRAQNHQLVAESHLGCEAMRRFPGVRVAHGYWRLRHIARDYKRLLSLAKAIAYHLRRCGYNATIAYKAKFLPPHQRTGSFFTVPAAGLVPGLTIPVVRNGRITSDVVVKHAWKDNSRHRPFFDVEVARSHNLITGGVVTHNSIYSFRGANYANILEFPERNPGTEIFRLETNYRSVPEILALANGCIIHNTQQYAKVLRPARPAGERPVLVALSDAFQEATFIAERILQLRDEGVALREIAVLYRAHAHSTLLQAELIKRDIPYDIRSGLRFFEQAHIKDVVAHLKVLWNPHDETAWRRLLLMVPKVGLVTAGRVWERIRSAEHPLQRALRLGVVEEVLHDGARKGWRQFRSDLHRLQRRAEHSSPAELVREVLDTAYVDYLKARYDNAQARLEEIDSLALFAESYTDLDRFLSELVLLGELYGQEVRGTPSQDPERLILSTVHQAKGLEWQAVFLMRLCEEEFPSARALRDAWGEEEERRVFYVAVTRAKDQLYLTYPAMALHSRSTALLQPSRFLQELDAELYEEARVAERWE